jgi:uncharacterized protein YxjI
MYVIRERFFALGDDFDITDDAGYTLFHVDGKAFSLRNRLVVEDPLGREVAAVHRHLVSLRPTYEITVGGEKAGEVRRNLFTPFRERFTIDVPGPDDLEITGDLFDHEFVIERNGRQVASVSKRWLGIRDAYGVRVAQGEDPLVILASVLALDLALAKAREDEEDDER